jgi:hypothetical protein
MKTRSAISLLLLASLACSSAVFAAEIKAGDKLYTLSNLHPDMKKRLVYTMNYQLGSLIPVCSEITVKKVSGKKMEFDFQGAEYTLLYEKYTEGAGVSFQEAAQQFFGPSCDQAKLKSLSQTDKDGIQAGRAHIGMTKEGVLFAMGRPPKHATPSLDGGNWMYWQNRFGKLAVEFDAKGKVTRVVD